MSINVSLASLPQLSAMKDVSSSPLAFRSSLARSSAALVHIGVGGFHRSHMALYTQEILQLLWSKGGSSLSLGPGDGAQWAIRGFGLQPQDQRLASALLEQDFLYTLVERSGTSEAVKIVGSIVDVTYAGEGGARGAVQAAIADPAVRIVSITVSEAGYVLNAATKELNLADPCIQRDLAAAEHEKATTVIGILVEGLSLRRAAAAPPLTILCCDNIQHNGKIVRDAVLAYALASPRDGGSDLASWILANISFPSSMVDRITPVTQPRDMEALASLHGIVDKWPVVCEEFRQWVIEDKFANGRPPWELAGAQFVSDVAPYETMKLRLLNGSHLAVACLGDLAGLSFIHETMEDSGLREFMASLMDLESGPTVPPVPGIDLPDYKATLLRRFANPAICDTVLRVATDAPLNVVLDTLRDRLASNQSTTLLCLVIAAWLRRATCGVGETGREIIVRHPLAAELFKRGGEYSTSGDVRCLLGIQVLFGETGRDVRVVEQVGKFMTSLRDAGVRQTVTSALETARRSGS